MNRALVFLCAAAVAAGLHSHAAATRPGEYYIRAFAMNVRLGPDSEARAVGQLFRRDHVEVLEVIGRWARITEYYPSDETGESVANWVSASYLSAAQPRHLAQPALPLDSRIRGLPRYGEHGLSKEDLQVLYAGAHHFLDSGRCQQIEFGDKSFALRRTFYVNCGAAEHVFFSARDLGL